MKILDNENNLEMFLASIENKQVFIVTAFASGTEYLIEKLLENENKVELIIGTINAFSSPALIDFCAIHKNKKLSTFVDFRYQNSIHWKLYLIEPNIVIIGSANFTTTGILLTRDTCVVIEDEGLFNSYIGRINGIKKANDVIKTNSATFCEKFEEYRLKHQNSQNDRVRSNQYGTIESWLEDEYNQSIPLFIWTNYFEEGDRERADEILEHESSKQEDGGFNTSIFKLKHTYQKKIPYKSGDTVLSIRNTGIYPIFYTFDLIIYDKKTKKNYIYQKGNCTSRPFKLDETLKQKIKIKFREADISDEQCSLERSFLESLITP
jgi:hypothetical protein